MGQHGKRVTSKVRTAAGSPRPSPGQHGAAKSQDHTGAFAWLALTAFLALVLVLAICSKSARKWILRSEIPGALGATLGLLIAIRPSMVTPALQGPIIAAAALLLIWIFIGIGAIINSEERREQTITSIHNLLLSRVPVPVSNVVAEMFALSAEIQRFSDSEILRVKQVSRAAHPVRETPEQLEAWGDTFEREISISLNKFNSEYQPRILGLLQQARNAGFPDEQLEALASEPVRETMAEVVASAYNVESAAGRIAKASKGSQ